MNPTDKRLNILKDLPSYFDYKDVEGVILGGSLVFSKYHKVTEESDIDLLIVVKPENFSKVVSLSFFKSPYINDVTIELFEQGKIDAAWTDSFVDEIMLNVGFLRLPFFESFCSLEATNVRIFKEKLRRTSWDTETIKGEEVILQADISEYKGNYILDYPLYYNDVMVQHPLFTNVLLNEVIYDADGSINNDLEIIKEKIFAKLSSQEIEHLVSYCIKKMSPEYLKSFQDTLQ